MRNQKLVWLLLFAFFVGVGVSGLSEEVQTASATLSTVIQTIQENQFVSEEQETVLSTFFITAIEQGALSPDQALELLATVGWDELTADDKVGLVVRALELALIAVTAEDAAYDEVLATLAEVVESGKLGSLASEEHEVAALPGLFSSLLKTAGGMSSDFWDQVEELIAAGVPSGIVARTVRQMLRSGATEEEVLAALEALGEGALQGGHHGQAAEENSSTGNKHQDREENHNQGASTGPQVERENNRHGGSSGGQGKPQDDDEEEGHGPKRGKKG